MPLVDGKHFPYTKAGKTAAKKAAKKTKKYDAATNTFRMK